MSSRRGWVPTPCQTPQALRNILMIRVIAGLRNHSQIFARLQDLTKLFAFLCLPETKRGSDATMLTVLTAGNGNAPKCESISSCLQISVTTHSCCPDRLWGPLNHLSKRYQGLFLRGLSGKVVRPTTRLQLVPRSITCGSIHPMPHTPSWHNA
jgi:hypothetical protein